MEKTIKQRFESLVKRRDALNEQLKALQEECKHPSLTLILGANTGNWCEADDVWWTSHKCEDCGKYWLVYRDHKGNIVNP